MSITSVKSGATGISLALDNNFMEPIATTLVGTGGTNTIIFNDIPQGYKHLQLRGIARCYTNASASTFGANMVFNGDTSVSYAEHILYGNGTSALASGSANGSLGTIVNIPGSAATSSAFGVFVCDILDYTNTNKNKTVRTIGGYDGNDTNGIVTFRSFVWLNTTNITSITMTRSSDGFDKYSRFSLYGIKG